MRRKERSAQPISLPPYTVEMRKRAMAAIEAQHRDEEQLWRDYVETTFKMFLRRLRREGLLHSDLAAWLRNHD